MKQKPAKLFTFFDVWIWIGLLVGLFYLWNKMQSREPGNQAIIQIGNKVAYKVDLTRNQEINLSEYHIQAIVDVQNGSIRMSKSDCPKQICVKTGKIHLQGQTIVCVPHRVLIYIPLKNNGNQEGKQIYAITG